jgi:hypothetical protein
MRTAFLTALACLVAGIAWWIQQGRGCDAKGPIRVEGADPAARSEDDVSLPPRTASPPPGMSPDEWEAVRIKQAKRRAEEDLRTVGDDRTRLEETAAAVARERAEVDRRIEALRVEIPAAAADPARLESLQAELAGLVVRRQGLR